jgi:two-component system NtrC family sensor kinase
VLLNIIINAHQAMAGRGGEGVLTLRTRRRDATILIEIEDSGPGIADENLDMLFDPFFTTKDVGQGTGLGLSICYGIVKEHHGRVWARNAPGGGAVFTVELPICGPAPGSEMSAAEVERPGPSVGRRGNILVVDDEASILEILYEILKADGHRVDTAPNGRVAMRKIESQTYDLIISDLKMPGMSGQDLYRKILELKPEMSARVIFATGDVVGAGTQDFLERVGNRCLQKPFEIDTLRQIVNAALSLSSS